MKFCFNGKKESNAICIINDIIYLPKFANITLFKCLLKYVKIIFEEKEYDNDFFIFKIHGSTPINYSTLYYFYYYICE
jgi:hypothetical protein